MHPWAEGAWPLGVRRHASALIFVAIVATSPPPAVLLSWPVDVVGVGALRRLAASPDGVASVAIGAEALFDGPLTPSSGAAPVP